MTSTMTSFAQKANLEVFKTGCKLESVHARH